MTAQLAPAPVFRSWDNLGFPLVGGKLFTYQAGTTTPQATYIDSTQTTPNTNPVVLNFRGEAFVWLDPTLTYKFILQDVFGNLIWTEDNIPGGWGSAPLSVNLIPSPTNTYTLGNSTHSWANLYLGPNAAPAFDTVSGNIGYYARTAAEIAASVTPTNYGYPPGNVLRYGAKGDGVNDDSVAINAAAKCSNVVYFPTPNFALYGLNASYGIKAPIFIASTAAFNLTFLGESRVDTIIQPLVIDLSVNDPNHFGINAMFINQLANGKASWSNIRLSSQLVAFTGVSIYAIQGNGGGTIQSIFSGSMDDCWFDTGSTNAGFFQGGFDNYRVSNCTFEFQKGAFYLQGAGGAGDVIFTDCVLSNCFDFFIQKIDATNGNIVSVKGLHAYTHNRGQLFNITNASSFVIDDVILQASTGGANLGSIGIGIFQNCTDIQLSDLNVLTSGSLSGATATQLTFNNCTGQVSDSIFDGCDTGILITGGAMRLSIDHVDIVNTLTAAFRTTTATASGVITVNHCNWSDGNTDLILFSQSATFDFLVRSSRLMNAGLTAGSGARNIIVNTNATAAFSDCAIGQNNGSAAAGYYIEADGTGPFFVTNPQIIGSPPAGLVTGSQTVTLDGVTGTWTPNVGGTATYTNQTGLYSVNGKCVSFWGRLTINAIGTGSTGVISGLPFTNNATLYGGGVVPFFQSAVASFTSLGLTVSPNTSQATIRTLTAAAASTGTASVLQNGTDLIFSGSYQLP